MSADPPLNDYPGPHPVRFRGYRLAIWAARRMGWTIDFDGLPTRQGVLVVYPHTSNWDFPVIMVLKWAIGIPVSFWGKDTLFRIPLFGRWLRWVGGVPVQRVSSHGMVGEGVAILREHARRDEYFWLGLAPEGTRKYIPGWRSGFYRLAHGAGVPLLVATFDWGRRRLTARHFLRLSGDEAADMARIATICQGARGLRHGNEAPVKLLDASVPRSDTIVR